MNTSGSYVAVAAADDIAEKSFACFEVAGTPVVVCRFKDQYYALENRCSHALATFDGGRMRGYRIMCPLHGGTFDIRDGSALGRPATRPIRSLPVRVVDGVIEVELPDQT